MISFTSHKSAIFGLRFLMLTLGIISLGKVPLTAAETEEFRRPTLEAAQRAIQARYVAWIATKKANGADSQGFPVDGYPDKIVWPSLEDGTPAGDYPKDCFYDKDIFDEETGHVRYNALTFLVADLCNKVLIYLPSEAYVPPQMLGRIAGLQGIPVLNPPQFPGSTVTQQTYSDYFAVACAAIKERSYPWFDIYPTDTSGTINVGGETRDGTPGIEVGWSECSGATSAALSQWLARSPDRTVYAKIERDDGVYFDGTSDWIATLGNVKGRYGFDHSALGQLGGSAEFYIRQFDPNLVRYGIASTVPLTATNAPFPRYREEYQVATFTLSSGGKYFSNDYGTESLTFVSPCSTNNTAPYQAFYGYALSGTVVARPDYKYQIDSLVSECHACKDCQSGSCSAPGAGSLGLGSIDYHVGLGTDLKGSAGGLSIYSPTYSFLMASPFGLEVTGGDSTTILSDSLYEEIPRQVIVPQGLVDITVVSPFKKYVIKFYDGANRGSKSGKFYQPVSGSEYKTITIENPGLSTSTISGTLNIKTNATYISSPGHGLTPGSYYVMHVDAASGALPTGAAIGQVTRKNLYYIYAPNTDQLAFLYWDASNQPHLDFFTDAVAGQILKFSDAFPCNNLVITETTGSTNHSYNYTYTQNGNVALANVVETTGSRVRSKSISTTTVDATHLTEVFWEQDGGGNVIKKTQRKYRIFPWNSSSASSKSERQTLVEETLDPDGAALKTLYTYNEDSVNGGNNYSRLQQLDEANGSWSRYDYDASGDAIRTYSSYLDAGPSSDAATCRSVEVSSSPGVDIADLDGDGISEKLFTTIDRVLGNEIGRSYVITWSGTDSKGRRRVSNVRCLEPGAAWDASANSRSDTWTFAGGDFNGELAKQTDEAGVLTLYAYSIDSATGAETTTTKRGVPSADGEDVTAGTKTVSTVSATGATLDTTTSDISSGIVLSRQYTPVQYIDSLGRATRVNYLDGTSISTVYEDCCGAVTTIDREGTSTKREQDQSGFLTSVTRAGIVERYAEGYTASGGVIGYTVSTYRKGRGDVPEVLVKVDTYDPAGRLIASRDSRDGIDRLTRYAEGKDASGRWSRSTTAADTNVQTSLYYRDGMTKEEQQNGVARTRFQYAVESSSHDGKTFFARSTKQIRVGDNDSEIEWVKQFVDPLGRSYRTEMPDATGQATGIAALNYYDSAGRIVRQADADGVQTLFEEDLLGDTRTEALDINRNGVIDLTGPDRVQRTRRTYQSVPGRGDVVQTTTDVWDVPGTDQPSTIAVSQLSTTGLDIWETKYGLTTHSQRSYSGAGIVQTSVESPDQSVHSSTIQRGVTLSDKTTNPSYGTLAETTNTVDGLDRMDTTTNAVTGAKTTFTYYDCDLVRTQEIQESATAPVQKTQFVYDNMNRVKTTILPDNSQSEIRYFTGGNVKARFGANTNPVEYTYDRQDRVRTMTTWQHFNDTTGAGISGSAVTTWIYNARGELQQKQDNSGKGAAYTFTPGGRVKRRSSARPGADASNPILTTYSYGPGGATDMTVESGDVFGVFYSNDPANTPSVENRYDRLGRLDTIADASGKRQLTYENGALDSETYLTDAGISPNIFGGFALNRDFDSLQRYAGIAAKNPSGAEIYRVGYGNDAASRLRTATFGATTVTYTYNPAAATRIALNYAAGAQTVLSVAQNFDALNRLTSRVSTAGAATRSVTYEFDSLNRRKKATRETASYWDYGYDLRGGLSSAVKKDGSGIPVPGNTFGYNYDDIGNRMTANVGGDTGSYTTNLLNQYTAATLPLWIDVVGSADPGAVITVDGASVPTRSGRNFATKIDVRTGASGAAHWRTLEITGVLAGGGVNGANRTATELRDVYVPQTPVAPQFDGDGNMVQDDAWHYYWDAENRLSAVENLPGLTAPITGAPSARKRLEFSYDSLGRRIVKKVYAWSDTTQQWSLSSYTSFLYDGWSLLAEFDRLSADALKQSYYWGVDLSGSLQDAGGASGLLLVSGQGKNLAPVYDGNGNIIAWLDVASATIASDIEYDAFGNMISQGAADPQLCSFGWSTKYRDIETNLLYYGLRYYSASLGRWLNRDPMEEQGGLNLYAFVGNNPVNSIDALGQYGRDVHGYFTYFAALAAGASVRDARTIGAYTWGPDASKPDNAIDVIYVDTLNTFKIQTKQHALTGQPPEPLRKELLATIPSSEQEFGKWSHVFEDSYAHVRVKHALWTALRRRLGSKAEYQRLDKLYSKGLGHFLSGTIPDHVSTSRGLFVEMARVYYGVVSSRYGGKMSASEFQRYAQLISEVDDSKREDFIKYMVRPCKNDDMNPKFDKLRGAIKRLNLDPKSQEYELMAGDSQKDWNEVVKWVNQQSNAQAW